MSNSNLELNKVFAALLVAGIVAMLAGFVAEILTETHEMETDAVAIEGMAEAGGAGGAEAKPEPILAMIASADVAKGEKLSKACAACHSFDQGGIDKVGPNLYGVVGRKVASHGSFAYSDAMKAHGGNWGYTELNQFLWSPKKFVPGTKMAYIGLKKPEDRAAMIAWLRTLGGAGLPSQGEIAAEEAALAPPKAEEVTPAEDAAATGAAKSAAEAKPAEAAPAH